MVRLGLSFLVVASVGLFACSGDHDALAAKRGSERDAGAGSDDAASDAPLSDADLGDSDGIEPPLDAGGDASPPLPFVLTVVNGMPDAPEIRLCFVPVVDGEEEPIAAKPLPEAEAGLSYGKSLIANSLGGIDLAATALRPYVLSGELAASVETCDALLGAPKEGVAIAPLPVLPAGTFGPGRSVLLVATGCVGGPDHVTSGRDLLCGEGESPDATTANLVVVAMSREKTTGIGLQTMHALASPSSIAVEIAPSGPLAALPVGSATTRGAIAPKPSPVSYEIGSFGASARDASIRIRDAASLVELGSVSVGAALEQGGLAPADFANGRSFTLVAVGPQPNLQAGPWWSAFTVVAVDSDPPIL